MWRVFGQVEEVVVGVAVWVLGELVCKSRGGNVESHGSADVGYVGGVGFCLSGKDACERHECWWGAPVRGACGLIGVYHASYVPSYYPVS